MAQGYTDNYSSTLSGGYSSGGTSLSVASVTGLPASGLEFYLLVAAELLNTAELFKVTSYSGTTLAVVGAQGNTSASNHSSGATITGCWISTNVLNGIRADQSQVGVYASLPASGMKKGDRYRCTDAPYEFIFDGTNFIPIHPQFGQVAIPGPGNFSWLNQGSSTESTTHGFAFLAHPGGSSSFDVSARVMAQPTKPYTITALMRIGMSNTFNAAGLLWRDSSGGGLHCVGVGWEGSATPGFDSFKANSPTSFNAHYSGSPGSGPWPSINDLWIRIQDDNTNRIFSVSIDGQTWLPLFTVGNTDFLTANQVGYWVKSQNTSFPGSVQLLSWVQS